MKLQLLLSAVLLSLSGCLVPTIQTDSIELVGEVEGTSAFAAIRFLSEDRVEAYLCDGQGEEPTIQAWLSGTREGNELSLFADNPYQNITLTGSLLNEDFEGIASIDGVEHAVSLIGATKPDGLYNVTFEDGIRRGWIVIGADERGPVQTLFRSNPIAFNDGSFVNVTAAGVVKLKTRFTANMLDGYTSSSLAPGRFLVEVNGVQALGGLEGITFSKAKLKSASSNQEIDLVYAPNLSSLDRAVFVAAPALQASSISLVDTFTIEVNPDSSDLQLDAGDYSGLRSRFLVVRQ